MEAMTLSIWSDYVCPWCYIGQTEVDSLREEFSLHIDWRPFLLRPDAPEEGWALPAHIKRLVDDPHNPLTARAQRLGLTIKHRDHIPNSRRAHECTEFARAHGQLDSFHQALLRRYWTDGEDLHDWAVLGSVATQVGLDATRMQVEVEAGAWRPVMEAGLTAATQLGIRAVPTFIVADRLAIQGAQEASVFREAFARLRSPQTTSMNSNT